jgi:glycine/D-amino acid oxidase-like deaminating enzyme
MNLRSPEPYWLLRHGIINSYPSLHTNIKTDIAIIGAGISGALLASELSSTGHKIVVLDRRHAGTGSTAASTALLQYEIDTPLHKLVEMVGEKNAVKSYLLCRDAIDKVEKICTRLQNDGLFVSKPSLQYASYKKDDAGLRKEYQLRKKAGIAIQWLEEKDIRDKFGFKRSAALLSKNGAEADAYRIAHKLLRNCIKKDVEVYDNTEVVDIRHEKRGVVLTTADNKKIHAKKLFIACGYESQKYIPFNVQLLHSTYAIASEPFETKDFWHKNALIWETATPYLYMRTTDDCRIIIGGKDVPFTNPGRRDEILPLKTKALEMSFKKLFPAIPFKTDFKWTGNFAGTKDGLPYIGSIPQRPHTYFALGFGGNGITFSVIAARLLKEAIEGKKNPDLDIFSFNR